MGARLLVLTDQLSLLGGIFDGDQAGPGPGDPQERNRYGVNFRVNDPPLLLGQMQYAWNNKKGDPNLTGQIKFGGWQHFGSFADQRLASNGVSLAAPASSGEPLLLSGDIGGWAVLEQQVYRVPHRRRSRNRRVRQGRRHPCRPQPDRSLRRCGHRVHRSAGRATERQVRDRSGLRPRLERAQALDADYRTLVDPNWPVRSFEGLLTAVYQYQIKDGWTVQPNFQYILHPGGGATLPTGPLAGKALRNASVFGLRTTLKF
ncbi:carbohydrate porin [Bradyrhizobium elkanii]|jgi:porin|uniref:carbohydrate porin n=1 Tax=Bradyrhizobium elkanii TaxID=29448 RepID=UPI0021679FFE|nr:carbohydrate porin [Bradyrhizobium elkanii]WLA86960.1 carbohydrate porin [Bradyrhizobium elkanii]